MLVLLLFSIGNVLAWQPVPRIQIYLSRIIVNGYPFWMQQSSDSWLPKWRGIHCMLCPGPMILQSNDHFFLELKKTIDNKGPAGRHNLETEMLTSFLSPSAYKYQEYRCCGCCWSCCFDCIAHWPFTNNKKPVQHGQGWMLFYLIDNNQPRQ